MPRQTQDPRSPQPVPELCTGRLVQVGPRGPRVITLARQPVTLGRGPGVDELLEGARVSRQHLRLEPLPAGGHLLVDLGSSNGTLVNDRRVPSAALEPFDRVRVGDQVLVYLDPETSAEKVIDLMTPGETSPLGQSEPGGPLAERLLALTLMVQERGPELELITTLEAVLDELLAATGFTRGLFLVEQDEGDHALHLLHARGVAARELDQATLGALGLAFQAALQAGRPEPVATPLGEDTLCVPMESRSSAGPERRRMHPGEVCGALLLAGRPSPWRPTPREEPLFLALARQVALVIGNARLERQVSTDALTGLPNRSWLERLLAEALLEARASGAPVGVILLDIDDFKRVNDTRGHAAGDAVLRHVGDRLRWALRHTDSAGRWGGEEFLVVLPGADLAGAAVVAEKVVHVIGTSTEATTGVRVTVSAGVAAAPLHGLDLRDLVERADLALYAAKRAGKNRHREYSPELEPPLPAGRETVKLVPSAPAGPEADELAFSPALGWLDCELLPSTPLRAGTTSLGRSPACDLVLPHRNVSRQHGLVHVSPEGRVTFEDCSRNGSNLNGVAVADTVELRPGDQLEVGPYKLTLRREARPDALDTTPGIPLIGGKLEEAHLCALLLRLESTRATGALSIHDEEGEGRLLLREGQPVSASAGALQGVEAVRWLLSRKQGVYVFLNGPVEGPRAIPMTTSGLILLACPAGGGPDRSCPRGDCCRLDTTKLHRQHYAG